MAKSLSRRNLETLSAYLDGQLSPRNMRKLESRLGHEPDLKRALEQLRQTRHALRSAPQARAPRSFTLTPEMAGQRVVIPRGYTLMRVVAMTASLMFAVVVVGELLLNAMPMAGVAFAPAPEKSVAESYALQDLADEDTVAAAEPAEAIERAVEVENEIEVTEAPVEEPDTLGAVLPTGTVEGKAGEGMDAVEFAGTPTLEGTPAPPAVVPAPAELPLMTEIPPPAPSPTATLSEEVPGGVGADDANVVVEPGADQEREEEETIVDTSDERGGSDIQVSPIRLIEGGLVIIALLSGGVAFLLHRRMH